MSHVLVEPYGVSFPMMDKVDVNGEGRTDAEAVWNFEKRVLDSTGTPLARFRSRTEPTDPQFVGGIEAELAERTASH